MSDQATAALEHANTIRLARSHARHELAAGRLELIDVLEASCAATAPIFDVLRWQRRVGRIRAKTALNRLRISESRPCGTLTARERSAIVQEFRR
jgi:hypothetical protein